MRSRPGRRQARNGTAEFDPAIPGQRGARIAVGTGADLATESSAVTLVGSDLNGITGARNLSRYTMRNVRGNLIFAFVYNALGIPIAAGVPYPFFEWQLSPLLAAAAMSLSSVPVILKALRLRNVCL